MFLCAGMSFSVGFDLYNNKGCVFKVQAWAISEKKVVNFVVNVQRQKIYYNLVYPNLTSCKDQKYTNFVYPNLTYRGDYISHQPWILI